MQLNLNRSMFLENMSDPIGVGSMFPCGNAVLPWPLSQVKALEDKLTNSSNMAALWKLKLESLMDR